MRVLLVDDLPENIRLLEMLLHSKGYDTEAAGNGHQALEKARLRPPDVIVSDILMPGMDGFALCRAWALDPALCSIPFVFYTATYQSEEDEALGLSLGAVAFLRKPLDPDRFVAEVEKALETVRSGTLPPLPPAPPEEPVFLKLYNERLITKLEKREVELRISENRYRTLFEASRDAIFLADPRTGLLLDANPAACALVGRSREQLAGQHQTFLHPPEDAELYRRHFSAHADPDSGRFLAEGLVLHADGRRIPVEITASVFETQTGPALMGVFRDLTERKSLDDQAEERRAFLETIAGMSPDVIYLYDAQQKRHLYVSREIADLLGYSTAKLKQRGPEVLLRGIHPDDLPRVLEHVETLAHTGSDAVFQIDYRIRGKDGDYRWFFVRERVYRRDRFQAPEVLFGICQDITERKGAEEALRETAERLRFVVDGTRTGMWDWDLATNRVKYSRAWKQLLGYEDEEVADRFDEWTRLAHPDDVESTLASVGAFLRQPVGTLEAEFRMLHKSGEYRWILSRATVRLGDDGKPVRLLGLHIDIDERKRAEEALRELSLRLSRAEEEERRRIGRELHDSTGQKLAALSMTVGLLQEATGAVGGRTEQLFTNCLATIEECAQEIRMHSYVLHPPLLDELGLAAAIADYVEGFSRRSGVKVSLDAPPDLARFPDEVEMTLFRVVQESLGNIHRHAGTSAARVGLAADAEQVVLEVSDQGRGMSADTMRAIENGRGSPGVGIAGMRERLRLVGGRLEVESGEGGTTIRAIVPLRREPT